MLFDHHYFREAMCDFLPSIEFDHMGVKDFLNTVVPSNTLTIGIFIKISKFSKFFFFKLNLKYPEPYKLKEIHFKQMFSRIF